MSSTPGPWTIGDVQWIMSQKSGMGYSYRPITAGSWEVAQVWEDACDREMEANVRLIAAAPDLLASLKAIVEASQFEGEVAWLEKLWPQVNAALDKAEGTDGQDRSMD